MGEKGFTLMEVLISIFLTLLVIPALFNTVSVWGRSWNNQNGMTGIQQNARMVMENIAREVRFEAGTIITPGMESESQYLVFQNSCNYRTFRYYVSEPVAYPGIPTLYRSVQNKGGFGAGIDQLTEPSRVKVQSISFCQISRGVLRIRLVLSDYRSCAQVEQELVVRCLNYSGSSSIMGIIVLSLLLVAASTVFTVNMSESKISKNHADGIVAQHLAEAGAYKAIFEIARNAAWKGCAERENIDGINGTYRVKVLRPSANGDVLWVRSIGSSGQAERIVTFAYVWPPDYKNSVYSYTLFAGKSMVVASAGSIAGLRVGSSGPAWVSGSIVPYLSNQAEIVPDIKNDSYCLSNIRPPGRDEIAAGLGLKGHIYYYQTNLYLPYTIKNYSTLRGNGIIFSDYDIKLEENVAIPDRVTLLARNNVIIGKRCCISKALIAAGQNIILEDNATFSGIAIAKGTIKVGADVEIKRDESVLKLIRSNYNNYF